MLANLLQIFGQRARDLLDRVIWAYGQKGLKFTLFRPFNWMGQWTQGEQMVRGTLGRMLFSNDDILKSVKVISGGEQGRMLFGKLILQKPNVLIMDEPTNHLDMESIEALNLALENYPGTLGGWI